MQIKKLVFAPLFLSLIATLYYLFKIVLDRYMEVFFGTLGGLQELGLLALIICAISLSYCLYITLTQNVKYYLILAVFGSFVPFLFLVPQLALVACVGLLISLSITYFNLQTNLKTYTNFQPVNILASPVKTLNTLLILTLCAVFYFHSNSVIQREGFKIPEPMVDWAIDLSLKQSGIPVKGERYLAQIPTLSQEQVNLLKSNPELLKQYGLNPEDLDSLTPSITQPNKNAVRNIPSLPTSNIKDIIKAQITDTLDQIVSPYLFAIPIVLAFLFYSIISFALWIISFLLNPTLLLIFYILERTGFIHFEKEMREVKKIVI